jgi:arsenite methyltransferase
MARRLFTPVQANQTLPLVRRIVADILERGAELKAYTGRTLQVDEVERFEAAQVEVRELIRELEEIGCSYKDCDFPSKIDGEPVLLCWRSDEPFVAWYHAPDAGYAGRKRIPEHLFEPLESECET